MGESYSRTPVEATAAKSLIPKPSGVSANNSGSPGLPLATSLRFPKACAPPRAESARDHPLSDPQFRFHRRRESRRESRHPRSCRGASSRGFPRPTRNCRSSGGFGAGTEKKCIKNNNKDTYVPHYATLAKPSSFYIESREAREVQEISKRTR